MNLSVTRDGDTVRIKEHDDVIVKLVDYEQSGVVIYVRDNLGTESAPVIVMNPIEFVAYDGFEAFESRLRERIDHHVLVNTDADYLAEGLGSCLSEAVKRCNALNEETHS